MKHVVDENLITALGLDGLPEHEMEQILTDIGDVIYDAIITRAINGLSNTDKTELEHLLAHNPNHDEIGAFLYTHVPDIDLIATEEISNFKKLALSTVNAL